MPLITKKECYKEVLDETLKIDSIPKELEYKTMVKTTRIPIILDEKGDMVPIVISKK